MFRLQLKIKPLLQHSIQWITPVALVVTLAGVPLVARTESEPVTNDSSFNTWCMNRERLSSQEKHTVDVLLQQVGTFDCDRATETLMNLTQLDLSTTLLENLNPLQSLSHLEGLKLRNNRISDLTPLGKLTNLTDLDLSYNQISNVTPLQSLANLKFLNLSYNQITDVSPLQSLAQLRELNLTQNKISDPSSLKPLSSLRFLYLLYNPISEQNCPIQPKYICRF